MSSWEDELDIDDSDILAVLRRKQTSQFPSAGSQPRPEPVANPLASFSLQHELASGVLRRFQKPRPSQLASRHLEAEAFEALDQFDLDVARKRKAARRELSTLRELRDDHETRDYIQTPSASGRPSEQEARLSQRSRIALRRIEPSSNRFPGFAGASSRINGTQRLEQPSQIPPERPFGRDFRKQAQLPLSQPVSRRNEDVRSFPHAEDAPPDPINEAEREGPKARSIRPMSLQKDLPYQIPGPAVAIQRAFAEKAHHSLGINSDRREQSAPRNGAEPRGVVPDDTDFRSGPWLKAMDYVKKASFSVSSISAIKTSRTDNRIPKLVAVIKTCTPNGCGDVFVNLKDHSDAIGGTINRRVMTETEFGRHVEAGAVILLHQVAVFSPTPFAHYLNITINNVEQVFGKGTQFPKEQPLGAATSASKVGFSEGHRDSLGGDSFELEQRMGGFGAQRMPANQTTSRRSQITKNFGVDDDIEILHVRKGHACTEEDAQQINVEDDTQILHVLSNHTHTNGEVSTNNGQGNLSSEANLLRVDPDWRANICSAPVCPNDGYDQLLDDTDLFQCLQVRASVL